MCWYVDEFVLRALTDQARALVVILVEVSAVQLPTPVSMGSSMQRFRLKKLVLMRIRPTTKRIPSGGQRTHMIGKETILSTLGPMAVDRASLEIFMSVVLDAKPWRLDPSLTVKKWTPYQFTKPLKIAVQWWDGVVTPHPPMIRALREVSGACKAAGMEVVEWDCESLNHRKGWDILSALYWTDGGAEVLGRLEDAGEPVLPLTKFIIHEQPNVKNLNMHELWQVRSKNLPCLRDDNVDVAHLTALFRERLLSRGVCSSLDRHREE